MTAADKRDAARARLELTIHKQISQIFARGVEAAMQADMGCMADADGLAGYQRDRDRAIQQAARQIIGRAEAYADYATAAGRP
jgi:hypothetical protein